MFIPELSGMTPMLAVLFIVCLVLVFAFEFVNGFHDTANAVATVIYTKSLKPVHAVIWSGTWNFIGVVASSYMGLTVAVKIANLLPVEALMGHGVSHGVAMVLAVLVAAMVWNLGTWYFGIPCSSSHTLIGSILGVGLAFSSMPENIDKVGVNWGEAKNIANALLFSPLFGFSMAITLMLVFRSFVSNKQIFKEPKPDSKPPIWIRAILITTCTLVSYAHGGNDGQKGVGIVLIILMTFAPLKFALSPAFDSDKALQSLTSIENALPSRDTSVISPFKELTLTVKTIEQLKLDIVQGAVSTDIKTRLGIRKRLNILTKSALVLVEEPNVIASEDARNTIRTEVQHLKQYTNYAPFWIFIMVSVALGLGTMIGWKRIVVTLGEKIGKRHMTYAEGATAEVIGATTILLATQYGLPVSTTHVLSSGIAGSMVASKGVKNLQSGTIGNIALAWVLTLPATMALSGGFYLLFRMFA